MISSPYIMNDKNPLFILAGNGPYDNRGCEAITRGTVEIVRYYFKHPRFLAVSHYKSNLQLEQQQKNETDEAIIHKKTIRIQKRFDPIWFLTNTLKFLCPIGKKYITYKNLFPYLNEADAILSVGGDNYSLDYGIPTLFTDLDDLVLSRKKPLILWGNSVGPFDKLPEYERYIIKHLRKVTAIFARESATVEYLASKGVSENVYEVADPAFLMKSSQPSTKKWNMNIREKAMGVNLSPLLARYITNGNLNAWINQSAKIIKQLSEEMKLPIYLIYHVTSEHTNDYEFLKNVLTSIGKTKEEIVLIPPNLNAGELKWVISKMAVFAGARTHSVIAALSSCVPALSFSYSMKAKGINKDIFGHALYCLEPNELVPGAVVEKMKELLQDSERIKENIKLELPNIIKKAEKAGKYLYDIIINNSYVKNHHSYSPL